ncbi:MAG: hypothetical protein HOB69_02385 [Flavobacterium sp.]|jgi:hypothetical protein|nr:hypothetical protein [Flavobacterium sp.]
MKQLREHIKKEIRNIAEELGMRNYPLPTEIKVALERDLKLRPLIRYVNNVKAANTVPPSYTVFLHNGQSLSLYIEETSIVAKIGPKSYWLMNVDETNEAIKELNRLLTQPIPSSGETDDGETAGDEGGAEDAGGSSDTEMEPEEPAEEDPV